MRSVRFLARTVGTVIALAAAVTLAAAAGLAPSPLQGPSAAAATRAAATVTLSPAQMAGQRVIYSYAGLTPPASLLTLISHGEAAGVIFFGGNISGHAQIRAVIAKLEQANSSSHNPVRAPLLLMTDQEGGRVRRLSGAPLLSERQIGESTDPAVKATLAGTGAAHNLAGVGMNVNLAPVLDVYRAAGDFDDQYGRSYSMNAAVVSELGGDFITAQQKAGVAATAKHFPGLGPATRRQNTDLVPVTLKVPLATLRATDEFPYKAAIGAGVHLVMVSWAVYPALDASRPAGLSGTVVNGELRGRLGFKGVTITDALEAGAVQPFGTIAHRTVLAARAGMDLILCSQRRVTEGEHAMAALQNGYADGTLNKATFAASLQRVLALRASLGG